MSYEAEISRSNPTCFLFLIDQSGSMADPIMGISSNGSKSEFITDAINRTIQNIIVASSKDTEVRRYFQIGAIGYGNSVKTLINIPGNNDYFHWIDEIYNNPIRIEDRIQKVPDGTGGVIDSSSKFPIWVDPEASGRTPMCEALTLAIKNVGEWVDVRKNSYPVTIINFTDGEATDGDPRVLAEQLKNISTEDGKSILITVHASSNQFSQQIFFPSTSEELPDNPSRIMYEMSSEIHEKMRINASEVLGTKILQGAKGLVYNAGIAGIVQALEIGTRPSTLR